MDQNLLLSKFLENRSGVRTGSRRELVAPSHVQGSSGAPVCKANLPEEDFTVGRRDGGFWDVGCSQVCPAVGADGCNSKCKKEEAEGGKLFFSVEMLQQATKCYVEKELKKQMAEQPRSRRKPQWLPPWPSSLSCVYPQQGRQCGAKHYWNVAPLCSRSSFVSLEHQRAAGHSQTHWTSVAMPVSNGPESSSVVCALSLTRYSHCLLLPRATKEDTMLGFSGHPSHGSVA
ncbi:hypothetical protein MHYP_G00111280 [Metynnis hypsauchen]